MKIGSHNEYIELIELERLPEGIQCSGDINLQVTVKIKEFQGSYSGVWLEVPEMKKFLEELKALDKSRKGSAKISSTSPEEFILEIRSSDNLGHIEIETQLHRLQWSGPTYWPILLKGGFEVEPEAISELILCFKNLTNKQKLTRN